MSYLFFQIANRLDRVVADLGRKPLKVLVQVNTSGEECGYSNYLFNTVANTLGLICGTFICNTLSVATVKCL